MYCRFRPVLTANTGLSRPVFLRSSILKIQKTGPLVRSFPVLVRSSLGLFPVLRLDLQTLVLEFKCYWMVYQKHVALSPITSNAFHSNILSSCIGVYPFSDWHDGLLTFWVVTQS